MGKTYDQLDKRLHGWIAAQHIFFVATDPQRRGGHVNLSPKGHADTFAVLDERTVAYLDLTGSAPRPPPTCATTGASPSGSAPSPAHRGSCACMGRDGSSSPVSNDGTSWQRGSWPAAAPVPLLWSRSSASRAPAATRSRSTTTPGSATYSTSGQGARTRPPLPPTVPSATAGASTASPLCPWPPVTGGRARAEGRVERMSECSRNAPWRLSRGPDRRHVDA